MWNITQQMQAQAETKWPFQRYAPNAPYIGQATATAYNTADVEFTAPAFDGKATITTYTAISTPGGFTGVVNQAGSGTITITGLTELTNYTFTVTATNSMGDSVASTSSNSITTSLHTYVPDAPTIGSASVSTYDTATVTFTAPAFDGKATITRYTATSTPGGFTGVVNQAGSGTITITGLSPTTSYTFKVTATNIVGISSASNSSNSITTLQHSIAVTYMVVAGGGGGGDRHGGGGGGGGYRTGSDNPVVGTSYSISVGGGGTFGAYEYGLGSPAGAGYRGTNSSLYGTNISVVSYGGGGGSTYDGPTNDTTPVGSGGGGAGNYGIHVGRPGTPGQGNSGGNGQTNGTAGGGGGGAWTAGYSYQGGTAGGTGGYGYPNSITGGSYYYYGAGGSGGNSSSGAGASGGYMGGGYGTHGDTDGDGGSGATNSGSGGGGTRSASGASTYGGYGGSGVVIISIPDTSKIPSSVSGASVSLASGQRIYRFNGSGSITF